MILASNRTRPETEEALALLRLARRHPAGEYSGSHERVSVAAGLGESGRLLRRDLRTGFLRRNRLRSFVSRQYSARSGFRFERRGCHPGGLERVLFAAGRLQSHVGDCAGVLSAVGRATPVAFD